MKYWSNQIHGDRWWLPRLEGGRKMALLFNEVSIWDDKGIEMYAVMVSQ